MKPSPSLERLAAIIDPADELSGDERRQRVLQTLARFERQVRSASGGCLLWSGPLTMGYGQFGLNGRLYLSRRLAYEIWVGRIQAHERVFSTCGVSACVNYQHLEARPVAMPTLPMDRFNRRWVETEAGSWFLGLWTADGYLSHDASMSLALKDHDGVRLAALALGLSEDRIGFHRQLGQARIRVGVKWFLPRLATLGVTPGPKTGRELVPCGLEHNRHFWRGVVDGDGWVSPERRVIGLVTASSVLHDQYLAFLGNALGCLPTINVRNEGALSQLTLTGSNAAALASLLYDGSTFALPRKRAAASLLVDGQRSLRERTEKVVARNQRIISAYARGCSAYDIATEEAISAATIYYVLDRAGVPRRPREWYAAQRQHCAKGHPLDEGNTRIERNGARRCRTCARERGRIWARARRGQLRELTS
jgi:hypothetical protein